LIAFDTNILIYAEDPNEQSGRHETAVALIKKLAFGPHIIPVQVLGEFLNVCKCKGLVPMDLAASKVSNFAKIFETPHTQVADLADAAILLSAHSLQYFDALIITVAARAGATMLLSEDMQDGLEVDGLRVVNPFAAGNVAVLADYFAKTMS
jgi:predicted nucleic acid-binding protein